MHNTICSCYTQEYRYVYKNYNLKLIVYRLFLEAGMSEKLYKNIKFNKRLFLTL